MNRLTALAAATLLAGVSAGAAQAQNLVISNARVIVGPGQTIEKGSVMVKDGRIVSAAAGAPAAASIPKGAVRVDATGMTVMAGFIDDHRHLIQGPPDKFFAEAAADRMRELLESGVTTVLSGGDNNEGILELKKRVDSGALKGPHILTSYRGPITAAKTPDEARAEIRKAKAAGYDTIAEIIFPQKSFPNPPSEQENANLKAAIDEANKVGIPVQVHAVSPMAMIAAVRAGAKKLVHTPHFGWISEDEAKEVAAAGAQVSSCAGFGAPVFDVFNHDNKPTFRDGKPWPEAILDGQGRGREAGYKPVNGRTLFDLGVDYGYCTDTTYNATAALAHELKVLNLTFSPIDLIKVLGPNSADFLNLGKEIGTLDPGKRGDIVVLTGNPFEGYWNFLTAAVVVKDGKIVVDKRAQLQTIKVIKPMAAAAADPPAKEGGRGLRHAALAFFALLGCAAPAAAHHSLAAYDYGRATTLEGVVTAFHYVQPHPYLVIQSGGRAWKLEMDNLYELDGVGFTRDTFRPNDRVTATGSPMRDGSQQMYLRRLDRPADGLRYEQVGSSPALSRIPAAARD